MVVAAILKFTVTAVIRSLLHLFVPNFSQVLRSQNDVSGTNFPSKFSSHKIQDGGGRHSEITLTAI